MAKILDGNPMEPYRLFFRDLPVGRYFLKVTTLDKKNDGMYLKDGDIGYTLSIGSSMPEYILPHPSAQSGEAVSLIISNPTSDMFDIYIDGFEEDGTPSGYSTTSTISNKQTINFDLNESLKKAGNTKWLRIRSPKSLAMISEHRNTSAKTLAVGNVPEGFFPLLYTSHVATTSGMWQTNIDIVRNDNESGTVVMSVNNQTYSLTDLDNPNTKSSLNLEDIVGTGLPDASGWGSIENSTLNPGIAGVERFKTTNPAFNWEVELLLTPGANDHPGFVYFEKNTYLPTCSKHRGWIFAFTVFYRCCFGEFVFQCKYG